MNRNDSRKKLRICLAGASAISPYHLAGWRDTADTELIAICDSDTGKARARADTFGVPRVYADFREMLEVEQPDAVDIATPVGTHSGLTRIAADASVHVCCQKPLTPTVREAVELIAYVGDRVRFMVHGNYRFRPRYLEARNWLKDSRIGKVENGRMTVGNQGMISIDGQPAFLLERQPYLKHFERLLVFEVLIHHLDLLRSLLGPLQVYSVQLARVDRELAGEDVAAMSLSGGDGLTVLLEGNISAPGYPPLPTDRLEIMGDRGTLVFERNQLYVVGSDAAPVTFDLQKNYQTCFAAAVREFAPGVRLDRPFPTDRLDNLETLRLMEACYLQAGVEP